MSDGRFRALLAAVVTALAVAGCGGGDGGEATRGSDRLVVLSDVAPLAAQFEEDDGRPRLVLLLSPT